MSGHNELHFDAPFVQNFFKKEEFRRQSNKVLHGHPSPLYWKALELPASQLLSERAAYSHANNFAVNLYVGTPFCIKTKPARCGFCLFPSEDYAGNASTETYLKYLKKEFEFVKPYYGNDRLSSIYFGGGTPNLYHPEHYAQLMGYVDKLYGGIPSNIEITLEGIPQLFNEEKIKAISAAGFNRISMGVQQLNDGLIKYSGRRQTRRQVFDALECCEKYALANSIDLIYGWPEQSLEDALEDLKIAVDAGVQHITHYELNIAGRSDFSAPKKRSLLPSIQDNILTYHAANAFLVSAGFEQVTIYDWRRIPNDATPGRLSSYDYEHNMHHFVEQEQGEIRKTQQVCGIGFAAVNFHPNGLNSNDRSWIYMNHTSLDKYYKKLDDGELPVASGFMYDYQDVKLAWLFQSMQTMKINFLHYQDIFSENLLDSYAAVWEELDKRGWTTIGESEIRFVGTGQYYIPLLQSLIASKRLDQIRTERKQRISDIPVIAA